jgi:hypothetical protein
MPDATAPSALSGGIYVALSFRGATKRSMLSVGRARAPDPDAVAAVAGVLLGASHGVDVWPAGHVSRLQLAWVMNTLGRDLFVQVTDNPGGSEYEEPRDPYWWTRYLGW